jgi:predicted secreted hydrolase
MLFMEPEKLQEYASDLLGKVADAVKGPAQPLRDGTREFAPVKLPRDLYAHDDAQTEWWYYTGHMRAGARRFGFELVFFLRRTDEDSLGVVPMRLLGNPLYFAHFAITDEGRQSFRYEHRRSTGQAPDPPAFASQDHFEVRVGDWYVYERGGGHFLHATLGDDLVFEVTLQPTKPVALNGEKSDGVSYKDEGQASRYFAYTRMAGEGLITWHGKTEKFTGTAWMDREFGTWYPTERQKGWDWFSIQLSTGAEVMVYHLRDGEGRPSPFSCGSHIDPQGRRTHLRAEDFMIEVLGHWESPRTGTVYPSGWRVKAPPVGLNVVVTPVMADQELDTRGTTMVVYWEGACQVLGRHTGTEPVGRAYVELVGYNKTHEAPSLTEYLLGGHFNLK